MNVHHTEQLDRIAIRKDIRQRRRLLTAPQQRHFSRQVTLRIMKHPKIHAAHNIAVFLSFDGELDTTPLIAQLWRHKKQVYLPVVDPDREGHLLFLRYEPDTPLITNHLNVREPVFNPETLLPIEELDIILTPLVAFDEHGQRLGMGGGFYDRTLQYWKERGPYPIGLAHDCQQVESLPCAEWDIPLPEIITPSHHWQWNANA